MSGGTGTVTGRCPPNGPEPGSGAGTAFQRSTELLIEVWDHSPHDPALADAGTDSEIGRGLRIVDALATRWGVQHHAYQLKAVWAEMQIPTGVSPHGSRG